MIFIANYFTQIQYNQARKINILDYLKNNGYILLKSGNEYMLKEHDSLKISSSGKWYWHSKGEGGSSPIALLKLLEGIDDVEAVIRLSSNKNNSKNIILTENKATNKDFIIPTVHDNAKRVFAYLTKTRYIHKEIVEKCMKEKLIYETIIKSKDYKKEKHNAVFVCYDKNKIPRHATMRGTLTDYPFKSQVENGNQAFPFALTGKSDILYVFESAIDALSHATFFKLADKDWTEDYRIGLNGLNNAGIDTTIQQYENIKTIILVLNNDYNAIYKNGKLAPNWGQIGAENYFMKYTSKGYKTFVKVPILKDVNEDLVSFLKENNSKHKYYYLGNCKKIL